MAFVLLKDEDGEDFLCNTANIASITPATDTCVITVHKGAYVKEWSDGGRSRLQESFRLSAGKNSLRDAIDLADEIALADRDAKTLDLRPRCPPPLKKERYDPGRGW